MEPDKLIVEATQDDVDRMRGYKEEKWRDFTNYCCLRCQYSTVFEPRMKKHIQEGQHPWAFPSKDSNKLHDGFEKQNEQPTKLVY
jgi:hypothetical protein